MEIQFKLGQSLISLFNQNIKVTGENLNHSKLKSSWFRTYPLISVGRYKVLSKVLPIVSSLRINGSLHCTALLHCTICSCIVHILYSTWNIKKWMVSGQVAKTTLESILNCPLTFSCIMTPSTLGIENLIVMCWEQGTQPNGLTCSSFLNFVRPSLDAQHQSKPVATPGLRDSLVVEHDVRSPDVVTGHVELPPPAVLHRVPLELVVPPELLHPQVGRHDLVFQVLKQ